jgi:NAD(P)-dependent dehydrogenase (short-subunit alcohol dehydrogenase family)
MRAKIPTKLDSNGGAIVNVSILGGAIGVGGSVGHVAGTHGVTGLTKSVGLEYPTRNIRNQCRRSRRNGTEMLASGTKEHRDSLPAGRR